MSARKRDDGVGVAPDGGGRTGRRPGRPDTRQEILDAARSLFADRGFTGTSIRAVASAASVDPAMVPHYFGNKEGLFRAVLEIPIDHEEILRTIVAAGPEDAPRCLVETFLGVWDSPVTGPAMVSVLRSAVSEPGSTDLLRDFFGGTVLRTVAAALIGDTPTEEAQARVALVVAQMLGLVMLRRVIALEPVASMSADQLAAAVAPTISRYLHGDLPVPEPATSLSPNPKETRSHFATSPTSPPRRQTGPDSRGS